MCQVMMRRKMSHAPPRISSRAIPYWILLAGDFFAIVIVKQLFGGVGKNFLRADKGDEHPGEGGAEVEDSVALFQQRPVMAYLHENNLEGLMNTYSLPDMLVGFIGGSIGEVSALLLTGRPGRG